MSRRVVITGMGGLTALGDRFETIAEALKAGRSAVRFMPEWEAYRDVQTRLGAPIEGFQTLAHYPRRLLRSMGRVALLGVRATELALADAGLLDDPLLKGGRAGIAYGSSSGSLEPMETLGKRALSAPGYIQMMSHTAAVNIGLTFGFTGRVIPTSSACTSSSQAIGYAFEAIRAGKQDVMVAGGCDELTYASVGVFDTLYATSQRNDAPGTTPRPFDRDRDGLVLGEGGVTLVLEDRDHALARGATIHAEILGFGTNSDGAHITAPQQETMAVVMALALEDAGLSPDDIGWVNAHGTATEAGDIAETHATRQVFQRPVPITSLKSHFGHTLGACGSLEAWLGIEMLRESWLAPTLNLEHPDPRCAELGYVMGDPRRTDIDTFMTNNFAFGGINTSLVVRVEG